MLLVSYPSAEKGLCSILLSETSLKFADKGQFSEIYCSLSHLPHTISLEREVAPVSNNNPKALFNG